MFGLYRPAASFIKRLWDQGPGGKVLAVLAFVGISVGLGAMRVGARNAIVHAATSCGIGEEGAERRADSLIGALEKRFGPLPSRRDGRPRDLRHPVGQATAIASLDAVRALAHLPEDIREGGAKTSPRVVVVGGSQGGHAALWVDRLAPYYARELEIAGIAATVPPADMLGEARLALTAPRESTANMVAFYGASAGWYGAAGDLGEVLVSPLDKDVPAALGSSCDPGDLLAGKGTLDAIFQPSILDAAASGALAGVEPWGCMVGENGLDTTSVDRIQKDSSSYGILFVTGEKDTLVDTATERAAFAKLCEGGMPMQYLECTGASHTKATTWALPEILTFLNARLAGEPFTKACTPGAPVTCSATPAP